MPSSDEECSKWLINSRKSTVEFDKELSVIQKNIQYRDHGFNYGAAGLEDDAGDGWLEEVTHKSLSAELRTMLQEVNDLSKVFGGDNPFVLGRRIEVVKRLLILGQVDDAERAILAVLENMENSTPLQDRPIVTNRPNVTKRSAENRERLRQTRNMSTAKHQ